MSYEPWDTEPLEDTFEHAGYTCHMRRGPHRSWCGYVAVPPSHPFHGKSYSSKIRPLSGALDNRGPDSYSAIALLCAAAGGGDLAESCPMDIAINVHGGLTYSGDGEWLPQLPGAWWLGFDCSHVGDFSPGLGRDYPGPYEQWRDEHYVRSQLRGLAEQMAKYAGDAQ